MTAVVHHVDEAGIFKCISLLQESLDNAGVVIFPTETDYGIAARVDMPGAVAAIYEFKQRPTHIPLPVMVHDKLDVYDITMGLDERFEALAGFFWPGPLTLVLPKNTVIDMQITAGRPSVAVRVPSHEVPSLLLDSLPIPLAVSSANISNHDVPDDNGLVELFGPLVDVIILGETKRYPGSSTIVDLTSPITRIIRPGAIDRDRIESALRGLSDVR